MTRRIGDAEACARLDIDAFALDGFVRDGALEAAVRDGRRVFDEAAVAALTAQRMRRRAQALADLAALDAPHMPGASATGGAGGLDAPLGEAGPAPDAIDPAIVFLDACVLASALRRHLLLALAEAGRIRLRWSERVLFETGCAHARIVADKPGRDGAGEAARLVTALEAAFPEAMTPAALADAVKITARLPDPDDAHVIQAAAAGRAGLILTENMKDFPRAALKPLGLYARPVADFLASRLDSDAAATRAAMTRVAGRLNLDAARFSAALVRSRLGAAAKKLGL